jgi:uncharacterized tellurite resistance protein B-like protein
MLAASDGNLNEGERYLIYSIGKSRGLKDWQLENLLAEDIRESEVFVPETLDNRMNLLYDLMRMVYVDGIVDNQEVELIKQIIAKFRLRQQLADHLIDLFRYGAPPDGEWKEFVEHVNTAFVR